MGSLVLSRRPKSPIPKYLTFTPRTEFSPFSCLGSGSLLREDPGPCLSPPHQYFILDIFPLSQTSEKNETLLNHLNQMQFMNLTEQQKKTDLKGVHGQYLLQHPTHQGTLLQKDPGLSSFAMIFLCGLLTL